MKSSDFAAMYVFLFVLQFSAQSLGYRYDIAPAVTKNDNFGLVRGNRLIRKAGDQPDRGYCQGFGFGGTSYLHSYSCCNNCDETNPYCDGVTWQTASSGDYCASCGTDRGKGFAFKSGGEFRCGGCAGQYSIKSSCTTWLNQKSGFCWLFSNCFKRECRKIGSGRKKRESNDPKTPNTCYNLQCEPGESIENCPADCCYKKNPASCTWSGSVCIDECCGEFTCCLAAKAVVSWPSLPLIFIFVSLVLCYGL